MEKQAILMLSSFATGYLLKEFLIKEELQKTDCDKVRESYLKKNNIWWILVFVILAVSALVY